ncbi:glycosyl hydrolase [Clostridium niameyense]|uniref:Glycosyl hydrolase n=1 Tax=Clostridium niameyense TaxID=1622073 RepID=A0A6M0RAD9_9CLOT|nr:GH25 family lysozyme [Clostridium niameyense]NEZ47223.1 glycosyl hydrolase [Clostridium niameyense]
MLKGIDISNNNQRPIDFTKIKNSGVEIVYLKATEGTTFKDPYCNEYYNKAKAVGLKVGLYHFLVGTSSPESQAQNFYNMHKGKTLEVMSNLDIERNNFNVMDYALRFIKKFKELSGRNVSVYASPYFINNNLDIRLKQYPLWVAHYGVSKPIANKVWGSTYAGHQFTERGTIPGIQGVCDINNFNYSILENKGEKKVKNIVIYNEGSDQRAAEYLADFLSCPTISNSRKFDFSCVENVYAVGNKKENYTSYLKVLLSGSNRYETMQKVLDFVKKNS